MPSQVAEIKASWGSGGQAVGELFCLAEEADLFSLTGDHQGQVLALPATLTRGLWHKAKGLGVKGIICGAVPDKEFDDDLAKEILTVKGKPRVLALPLVTLGKEGRIPADAWQTLTQNQGKKIVIEGNKKRVLIPK